MDLLDGLHGDNILNLQYLPTVTIGCPVRDREWILPAYLESLKKLDYPSDKISFIFILNDSKDFSKSILMDFKKENEKYYNKIDIYTENKNAIKDKRVQATRRKIFKSLAELRNSLLEKIETDYFFSIDCDILVFPDTLKLLISNQKDIVAAVISNDSIQNPNAVYPNIRTNLLVEKEGRMVHYYNYPLESLFQVDCTGAIYLMTKEVCQKVRYDYDDDGEDIPFCINAKKEGFEIWADSRIHANHIMMVIQEECRDCRRSCIAPKYKDNEKYPTILTCPKKLPR